MVIIIVRKPGTSYSQTAAKGYPLTEVELNVLGLTMIAENGPPERGYVEQHAAITSSLAYMIVNDLNTFGFLRSKTKTG